MDFGSLLHFSMLALCEFKVKVQIIWMIIERPVHVYAQVLRRALPLSLALHLDSQSLHRCFDRVFCVSLQGFLFLSFLPGIPKPAAHPDAHPAAQVFLPVLWFCGLFSSCFNRKSSKINSSANFSARRLSWFTAQRDLAVGPEIKF